MKKTIVKKRAFRTNILNQFYFAKRPKYIHISLDWSTIEERQTDINM